MPKKYYMNKSNCVYNMLIQEYTKTNGCLYITDHTFLLYYCECIDISRRQIWN